MKFLTFAAVCMIFIFPLLIFLSVFKYSSFDNAFYKEKFSEYNVKQDVPEASSLHQKIIDFVGGKSESAPAELNEREQQHLRDVRKVMKIATIVFYFLIAFFALLLISSAFILKINGYLTNFIGKVMVFGSFLTIILAVALFFLITSDFSATFESFHKLFFDKGTYLFNPSTDVIVRLYPEQLFQDLGSRISEGVIVSSIILTALGSLFMFNSKPRKN